MKSRHRIATVYRKELIDILRDHRTLIAMIVVPIVLYPLLMLGSVQAVSHQAETLRQESITIGVVGSRDHTLLGVLIATDAEYLKNVPPDPSEGEAESPPAPLTDEKIAVFGERRELEAAIHDRRIPVGVAFVDGIGELTPATLEAITAGRTLVSVEIIADGEEPRGMSASRRLRNFFDRINERAREARGYTDPFAVQTVDMSSPASVLGAILPLILILMTITGAIYPAIDLTAGERERGTLESRMVCPVPVIDLIVGKFLVVTTVAVMGAALNLASVTATVYFGGFGDIIAQQGGSLPLGKMAFILIALVPFAVFMSAIMIAVCSYARTFKEAQNYVTPVILAVLIPGGIAAFPATRLEGIMLVLPVGNMVAFAKEMLLGTQVPLSHMAIVLLSTCLYAAAAVGVAAAIFGKETVVFADAGSLRGALRRTGRHRSARPSAAMGLMLTSLLFPVWFFAQSALSPRPGEPVTPLLLTSAWLMPLLFVGLPVAVMWYWKVNIASGLSLRLAAPRHVAAAVLIGASAWVPAHELNVIQQRIMGTPAGVVESAGRIAEALAAMHPLLAILIIAAIPAICEEILFRGFLLNALRTAGRAWPAVLASAAIFAVFHFFVFKLAVTMLLGLVLAILCIRAGSIIPAMVAHFLHNGLSAVAVIRPEWVPWLKDEPTSTESWRHLPPVVIAGGTALFIVGMILLKRRRRA